MCSPINPSLCDELVETDDQLSIGNMTYSLKKGKGVDNSATMSEVPVRREATPCLIVFSTIARVAPLSSILKNKLFMSGRGPVLTHTTVVSSEAANDYIRTIHCRKKLLRIPGKSEAAHPHTLQKCLQLPVCKL